MKSCNVFVMMGAALILTACASGEKEARRPPKCPQAAVLKSTERTDIDDVRIDMSYAQSACYRDGENIIAATRIE
jgi:hypothetical protein